MYLNNIADQALEIVWFPPTIDQDLPTDTLLVLAISQNVQ